MENREYKDSVFVDLFLKDKNAKENFLSLYNALHDTDLKLSEVSIEPEIIEQTLYHTYYNDVSVMINGKLIVLVEHQSTINENMPLRFLDYVVRLYERIVPQKKRYNKNLVHIPTPEFYVFYTGKEPYPDTKTLKLSDAYINPQQKPQLELAVDVYNISNPYYEKPISKPLTILDKCAIMKEYCLFISKVQEFQAAKVKEPIKRAIEYCIKHGILAEYLTRKSTEVYNLLVANYDFEVDKQVAAEEAFEKGLQKGKDAGATERAKKDALRMLQMNKFSLEDISQATELSISEIKELKQSLLIENI